MYLKRSLVVACQRPREPNWHNHSIVPRIENPLDFARRSRVLLMRHVDSGIDLDVTFGGLSFEQTASPADQSAQRWLKWHQRHPEQVRASTADESVRKWLAYREARNLSEGVANRGARILPRR
jgi:hypothetical protein